MNPDSAHPDFLRLMGRGYHFLGNDAIRLAAWNAASGSVPDTMYWYITRSDQQDFPFMSPVLPMLEGFILAWAQFVTLGRGLISVEEAAATLHDTFGSTLSHPRLRPVWQDDPEGEFIIVPGRADGAHDEDWTPTPAPLPYTLALQEMQQVWNTLHQRHLRFLEEQGSTGVSLIDA